MSFVKIKSNAKINLALNVVGKSRKLHKIESLIAFIELHDLILIKRIRSKNHRIVFNGKFSKNISSSNTISKLLKLLERKKLIHQKYFIKVTKNIPQKSGLGGGSMNAANILRYFIRRKIIKSNTKQISKIAEYVGSDVILGLDSTNSILNSKKKIKRYRNCKKLFTLVVKPSFGCSTKDIYSHVKKFDKAKFYNPKKKMFNLDYLRKSKNSLENIASKKYPVLIKIRSYLKNLKKPIFVRMSGSGSAFIAYYASKRQCDMAQKQFNKHHKKYWCISSKTI
jgi:4-diphosphocytidyl-2-C-methyl-D-erythritol kinase